MGVGIRDHRTIGKNCELGRLAPSSSHFLQRDLEHRATVTSDRRDPDRDQGCPPAGGAPEHGPSLERRRPAPLLPDQSARRPPLPTGRSAALPGGRRDRVGRRRPDRLQAQASGPAVGAISRRHSIVAPPTPPAEQPRTRRPWSGIRVDLALIDAITRLATEPDDLEDDLNRAVALVRDAYDHYLVAIWELRDDRLVPGPWLAPDAAPQRLVERPRTFGVLGAALAVAASPTIRPAGPRLAVTGAEGLGAPLAILSGERPELAVVIPALGGPWGVLHLVGDATGGARVARWTRWPPWSPTPSARSSRSHAVARRSPTSSTGPRPCAGSPATSAAASTSIGSCPGWSTTRWSCSRPTAAAVFLQRPDGSAVAEVSRGLSATLSRERPRRSRPTRCPPLAVAARRPLFAIDYRNDPRGRGRPCRGRPGGLRHGLHGAHCSTAPSCSGCSNVYHDRPHVWTDDDLETMAALATQASVAIRAAQDFERMATWAAQLAVHPAARGPPEPAVQRRTRSAWPSRPSCASSSTITTSASIGSTANDLIPVAMQGPGRRVRRRDAATS